MQCPREEGIKLPRAGVADSFEPPDEDAGNLT